MGKKGDKLTNDSVTSAEAMVEKLKSIKGISSKKMFGGHGIFHEGKMFGIVNSKGEWYLKADESSVPDFEEKGAHKHGRMPYYSIPEAVINDDKILKTWAKKSIAISK